MYFTFWHGFLLSYYLKWPVWKLDKCHVVLFHSIDNFNCGAYVAQHREPIILSQVSFESFDYGHGTKPMTSMMNEVKENFKDSESASASKGTNLNHYENIPRFLYVMWSFFSFLHASVLLLKMSRKIGTEVFSWKYSSLRFNSMIMVLLVIWILWMCCQFCI